MTEKQLFSTYDLSKAIQSHRQQIHKDIDRMPDERLLATDIDELITYFEDKIGIEMIVLGDEPEVSNARTKMVVGRYGGDYGFRGDEGVEVDAESYTLSIPFEGDGELFHFRGNRWSSAPPRGTVSGKTISHTMTSRQFTPEQLNNAFDRFIKDLNEYLSWLAPDIEQFNNSIPSIVKQSVEARRQRVEATQSVQAGLKFKIKSRSQAAPLTMPVTRKKVAPSLPQPSLETKSEPQLSNEKYEEILKVLRDMSVVIERSPAAFAEMDEETLRFHFLVPLNGQFEIDARGEVFNFNGKTDILITEKGKNVFIAECKFWGGEKAYSDTIDQLLGYLSWRDTKAAIIVFNRNKNFSKVLSTIPTATKAHKNFVREISGSQSEMEFRYLFKREDDEARQITLTVLAFDVPKPETKTGS